MNTVAETEAPSALPSTIFLVEDEPVLRSSMASGLRKMAHVDVLAAGTVNEAVALLNQRAPSLLISDIDLPGASGLDLVAELGRRQIHVPIILITAYLNSYRDQIPTEANVLVLEKPIPLQDLRMRVQQALVHAPAELEPPFNVIDCVQLARDSQLSARIEIALATGSAQVTIHQGEVWAAEDDQGVGAAAFQRLAFVSDSAIKYLPLIGDPGSRNISETWERLVLDLACPLDPQSPDIFPIETNNGREEFYSQPAYKSLKRTLTGLLQVPPELLRASPAAPSFDELWSEGIDALLKRQYVAAVRAFRAAGNLRQGNLGVLANLRRLEEMGYGEDSVPDEDG